MPLQLTKAGAYVLVTPDEMLLWAIPVGLIVLWYGAIAEIPKGWILCDGAQGTPDLRGVIIHGVQETEAIGPQQRMLAYIMKH